MMIVPAGVKVHLALGHTDMRKGIDGLALLVQGTLKKRSVLRPSLRLPRQAAAHIVKILLWQMDSGLCLFTNYLTSYCTSFRWKRAS